jgi:spore maturation protein CgeB
MGRSFMPKFKVLLIASIFRWYAESLERAFIANGCDVLLIRKSVVVGKWDIYGKIKESIGRNVENEKNKTQKKINAEILKSFQEFKPDIVYVTMGNQLTKESIEKMKESAILVASFGDTIKQYPYLGEIAGYYDIVYSYEMTDVDKLRRMGVNAKEMMGLGDPEQYFPINCKKDIDVCFVGVMYPKRKEILERLYCEFPDLYMQFYGKYIGIRNTKEYLKWLCSGKYKVFRNRNIHYKEVNKIYNRSKICLNINGFQTINGWASRLPEILLTDSFQIVDYNKKIAEEFEGCLKTYVSYEQLVEIIRKYLLDDTERNRIGNNGYSKVIKQFTYKRAIYNVLKDVEQKNQEIGRCRIE